MTNAAFAGASFRIADAGFTGRARVNVDAPDPAAGVRGQPYRDGTLGPGACRGDAAVYPLADEFFRLAHHDSTGRPRLHARATGLGLAAALLAELTLARKVIAQDGALYVTDRTPPGDALAHAVLDQLVAQPQHHAVRIWLDFLSREAHEQVARRLWRAGHVRPRISRRLLRQSVTWVPTDVNTAYMPWWRLSTHLRDEAPMDHADAFLADLAAATGLDNDLLQDAPASARRYLQHLADSIWSPLRELLVHTQAAAGDAVLHYRA